MKKLPLPLLLLGGALLLFTMKPKKTYKKWETDNDVTYVILKDGNKYWQFGIPTPDLGKRIPKIPSNASVGSKSDYDAAAGPVYQA